MSLYSLGSFFFSWLIAALIISVAALFAVSLMKRTAARSRRAVLTAGLIACWLVGISTATVSLLPETKQEPIARAARSIQPEALVTAQIERQVSREPRHIAVSTSPLSQIDYRPLLISLLLIGQALLLARLGLAAYNLRRLTRAGIPVEPRGPVSSRARVRRVDDARGVSVVEGLFSASILLPRSSQDWTDEQWQAVMLHESAHVQRRDGWMLVLAESLKAILWPCLTLWLLESRLREEMELAADEYVVDQGFHSPDYARILLAQAQDTRGMSPLSCGLSSPSGLKKRLASLLSGASRPERPLLRAAAIAGLLGIAGLSVAGVLGSKSFQNAAVATSTSRDVVDGEAIPATPENNFTGRFADGRTVEVVQLSAYRDGKWIYWKPNGEKIAGPPALPATPRPGKPTTSSNREAWLRVYEDSTLVLLKTPVKPGEMIGLGLGSGPHTSGSPSEIGFMGAIVGEGAPEGYHYSQVLVQPSADGTKVNFTASLGVGPSRPLTTLDPHGKRRVEGVKLDSLSLNFRLASKEDLEKLRAAGNEIDSKADFAVVMPRRPGGWSLSVRHETPGATAPRMIHIHPMSDGDYWLFEGDLNKTQPMTIVAQEHYETEILGLSYHLPK